MTDRQIITIQIWVFGKKKTWILANEQRLLLQGQSLTVFAAADEIQGSKNIRIWENLHLYCISHGRDRRQKLPCKGRLNIILNYIKYNKYNGCSKADWQEAGWGVSVNFAWKLSRGVLEHPGKPAVAPIEPTGSSPLWFQGVCLQEGEALMD